MRYHLALLLLAAFLLVPIARAQSDKPPTTIGGQMFMDYYYNVANRDSAREGMHGFTYRRMNLFAQHQFAPSLLGMIRLEANEDTQGPRGPETFVKDFWLRWTSSGGHNVTVGVQFPPHYQVSERVWGYRSVERMALDIYGIAASRDFGVRVDGPILSSGALRYAAMYANNSASRIESDKYKRGYAQLEAYPTKQLTFTLGGDYAGFSDNRNSGVTYNAFGGYRTDAFRFGVEGFWNRVDYDLDREQRRYGLSGFGVVRLAPGWDALAILHRVSFRGDILADDQEWFGAAGLAHFLRPNIRLIPNMVLSRPDSQDDWNAAARMTLEFNF